LNNAMTRQQGMRGLRSPWFTSFKDTGFTIHSSTLKVKADLDARNLLIVSTDAIRLMVNKKEYQEFMLYYTFSKPRGCAYAKIDVSEVILEI